MKISEALRKAAERVELGRSNTCCGALNRVTWDEGMLMFQACKGYLRQVGPAKLGFGFLWYGDWVNPINRNRRVVALCLAAAIAESEGQ